ncbi:uncharacterized protein LOC110059023, partial [Orbicella faveolata]|uniref:uncharacterized protein LOC110059023 n=1 Tax=Orbicella faveolata TaxID=48498 RepID=UPI0009E553AE
MLSFVVKILLFLLIFGLIASNVVDGSRSMPMKTKNGEEEQEHSSKNSTYKHRNQDGTVTGEEDHEHSSKNSTYKNSDKDDTELRAVVPQMVFNNPDQQCYTQFFVGGAPPTGLRTGQNLQSIKYICQMVNQQTYYGTMFDEGRGIAVYSGYTLTGANVNFVPNRPRPQWRPTEGIARQGSFQIYHKPYDRGHLVPGATYSATLDRFRSTFVYTNAVPQRQTFNRGQWSRFERRIRVYAQQCTQGPQPGTLYLITGTAFGHIQDNPLHYNPQVLVNQLGANEVYPAIAIPNSMWTAGCCVHPNGIESFA